MRQELQKKIDGAIKLLRTISEAYDNQRNPDYLHHRRHYAWLKYMRKPGRTKKQ